MNRTEDLPSEVVVQAYRAANRGRFADANRHVTQRLRRAFHSSAKRMRASNTVIAAGLPRIESPVQRAELRELVANLRQFEDPDYCWKGSTQGGSIASIEILRVTIRCDVCFVKVALKFTNGRRRVERARLIRERRRWLIDTIEVEVLQNDRMQLTAPLGAARRTIRRGASPSPFAERRRRS